MQIDLRTVQIKPLRQTYDHIARRFGDKPASRYQEASYDVQAVTNFHYRPYWDPEHEVFDASRTKIKMKDWYSFRDPRQFYYGSYVIARAKMQETAEADFEFVETRNLVERWSDADKANVLAVMVPLRHVAWGSNMNNAAMCAYGYGTIITQPCLFLGMDQLAIAQYITRMGLLVAGPEAIEQGKQAWLNDAAWQGLRKYVEDSFVVQDWFELFVAQNLVLDGLLFPLIYGVYEHHMGEKLGTGLSLMVRFQNDWYAETVKFVDAQIKIAAAESAENAETLKAWAQHYADSAAQALLPLAQLALGDAGAQAVADGRAQLSARLQKLGV